MLLRVDAGIVECGMIGDGSAEMAYWMHVIGHGGRKERGHHSCLGSRLARRLRLTLHGMDVIGILLR